MAISREACKKHHCHNHAAHHALGQTEIEAAALSYLAFHIEQADGEQRIGLAVFVDYALAVHESESETLALPEFLVVLCIANLGGVVHFLMPYGVHVVDRQSASGVADGYLHISIALHCLYLHASAPWSVFPGIVEQGVHHEEGQSLVCLHHCIGLTDGQRQSFVGERVAVLCQGIHQRLHAEVLDVERHDALPHFYPVREYLVVEVYAFGQFHEVSQAFLLHLGALVRVLQFSHLIDCTVEERGDAVDK